MELILINNLAVMYLTFTGERASLQSILLAKNKIGNLLGAISGRREMRNITNIFNTCIDWEVN